jgi:hypothetical protein
MRTNVGKIASLDDAVVALNPTVQSNGKTIIRVRPRRLGVSDLFAYPRCRGPGRHPAE